MLAGSNAGMRPSSRRSICVRPLLPATTMLPGAGRCGAATFCLSPRRKLRLRYGRASAGIMSTPGLVDATDQALRRAIPSIALNRLFITGSWA